MSYTNTLSTPQEVMDCLTAIEIDLAVRQNAYERAARGYYTAKRDIEKARATALLSSDEKSITEKKACAELAAYDVEGAAHEAEYEGLKAAIRVLETRTMIATSLLKAMGRIA